MSNIFTGQVVGLCKIASATPAAFCREVSGGSLSRNPNNVRKVGIGGQLHLRKGTDEVELTVTCVGIDKTDLALWFPTTAVVQVASFPNFFVDVDDGTNGNQFTLSDGQPGTCRIACGDAPDSEVEYTLTMKFSTCVDAARGATAAIYNAYKGHTINEIAVTCGGAQGCLSFELSNDLGVSMHNPLDGKSGGSLTLPDGYFVTKNEPKISLVTSNVFEGTSMDGDNWTAADVVITMNNGTSAQNITITCDDFVPDSWNLPVEAEGRIGFAHDLVPGDGTIYNRVQIA